MNVLPLRWQSASRIEAFRALVAERARAWAEQWSGASAPAVDVESLPAERAEPDAREQRWYALRDGAGTVLLGVTGATLDHLGCRFAGPAVADDVGLAAGIGRRALTAFARMLASANAPASLALLSAAPGAAATGARHGAIGVRVSIGTIRFEAYADAAQCALLMPVDTPKRAPLTPRRDALKPIDARFDAVLDLGLAALADTAAFKPGDVLKTRVPVDAGIRVVARDGTPVLSGTLVAEGGHRALKVVKTHLS